MQSTPETEAITLEWSASTANGATPDITYDVTETSGKAPGKTGLKGLKSKVTGLTPGTAYEFRVTAKAEGYANAASGPHQVSTLSPESSGS
ncbi:fibronectin type III domain-containing protein [Streptomyces sp. NPDC050485]|uniref:fibronectin type III domain-containing protein n=1 Tax=Streptomyces sp. NPDC050485 TaxID=3365617 RepID=UPI00379EB7E7